MVDDVDDVFRSAIAHGDIKAVFSKERSKVVSFFKLWIDFRLKNI